MWLRVFGCVTALVAASCFGSTSEASMIDGSLPLAGFGISENGSNLSTSTLITSLFDLTSGFGTGDYAPIPIGTNYGPVSLDLTTIASGGGVSIGNATYGSFAASSGLIVTQSTNFLDVMLIGLYTPGPGLAAGLVASPTSLRISVNKSGVSLAMGLTLESPPGGAVPEPASLALVGMGAISLVFAGWKRRNKQLAA